MTVVKMYCDRCGKEFEKWNHNHKEIIGIADFVYDTGDRHLSNEKDLCELCYMDLERWWNDGILE